MRISVMAAATRKIGWLSLCLFEITRAVAVIQTASMAEPITQTQTFISICTIQAPSPTPRRAGATVRLTERCQSEDDDKAGHDLTARQDEDSPCCEDLYRYGDEDLFDVTVSQVRCSHQDQRVTSVPLAMGLG
jgi:hypothetical protein